MAHILSSVAGAIIDLQPVTRALLSVSDKTGLIEIASVLASLNVELLSTGGTAKAIRHAGFKVIDVSDYTGSQEILVEQKAYHCDRLFNSLDINRVSNPSCRTDA